MKKLRIKNKEQFKEAIKVIAISIACIILTIVVAGVLKARGLESLFTTNLYQEAFETNPHDITLINRTEAVSILGILWLAYNELKSNAEMANFKREEEELCGYLLEH